MTLNNQFTDQVHIDHIRQRLWNGREIGRAAVMIGAGFSLNAEKVSTSVPRFPLWREIAEHMFRALYPPNTVSSDLHLLMTAGSAVLRLASEYETFFSRPALDDLLIATIADTGYHPGNLHRLLLSLPWSDVFTTNYDTLLERTLPYVHERKYDLVLNLFDIPVAARPRIVKLHGSFPSQRPFIITEDDFRTYPEVRTYLINARVGTS